MEKRKIALAMLGVLILQNVSVPINAFGEATTNHSVVSDGIIDQAISTEGLLGSAVPVSESDQVEVVSSVQETEQQTQKSETGSDEEAQKEVPMAIEQKPSVNTMAEVITDELLETMSITSVEGQEYSQIRTNRLFNATPVIVVFDFSMEGTNYAAGSSYTFQLPEHLGYSDSTGAVEGIGATWTVDAAAKTMSICFNQRIVDTHFTVNIKTYLITETDPVVTIETPGKTPKKYIFDLFETVDSISYKKVNDSYGLHGEVFYNLDRSLAGQQTLEVITQVYPGAVFDIENTIPTIATYDVTVTGSILPETKQILTPEKDYTIVEDSYGRLAVAFTNMDQQKAYSILVNRDMYLEKVTDYNYAFTKSYSTTSVGKISLKQDDYLAFTAKVGTLKKEIAKAPVNFQSQASMISKGNYLVTIFNNLTKTKAGQQIVLESKHGQALDQYKFSVFDQKNQTVSINDYFRIEAQGRRLVLTATKDSILKINMMIEQIDFDNQDFALTLATPVLNNGQVFDLILDEYVEMLSLINSENAEVTWGNTHQKSDAQDGTAVMAMGKADSPVENLIITVKHPAYLSLRIPQNIYSTYFLDQHYTIKSTADGSVIQFLKPITHEIAIPIDFNYVPDGLTKNVTIPIDTIPIKIEAKDAETIDGTVVTNQKRGAERTLQSSSNKFLINARSDSYDSLKIKIQAPKTTEITYDLYDVSNDQVDSIHPQYWDRSEVLTRLIDPESERYPAIVFNQDDNSYIIDFGQTNKRYIMVFKNANGWIDTLTTIVTGTTAEPLNDNQSLSAMITLPTENGNILTTSHSVHDTYQNITENIITTKNINDSTRQIKNPIFTIKAQGSTNAEVDLDSISIPGISETEYSVEKTSHGAQIIFSDYTLTTNITIHFRLISNSAGNVYTRVQINSETLDQTIASRKVAVTSPLTLRFSDGAATGVAYLADAIFYTCKANDSSQPIPGVQIELKDLITGEIKSFTSSAAGNFSFVSILTGDYQMKVIDVPEGFIIADDYRLGKTISIVRGENTFEIPFEEIVDQTSITVKDITIYDGDPWQPSDNFLAATDKDGQPVTLNEVTVSGAVITTTPGVYQIIYSINDEEVTATVQVLPDQTSIAVKDSILYVGDSWQASDNLIDATDQAGQPLVLQKLKVTGTVDTTKAGSYEVCYEYRNQKQIAKITVLADQTTISAKDSTIYVGTTWQPIDNFVSSTNKEGTLVPFTAITVEGTVDTTCVGEYKIRYRYEQQITEVTVRVVKDQATVVVKDIVVYLGEEWTAKDNFLSATDHTGTKLELTDLVVSGTVDPKTVGTYEVSYQYGAVTEVAKVIVKEDRSSITVIDSTIYVGDNWEPQDNFVHATDEDGNEIAFEEVSVEGTVKTTEKGNYEILYTANTQTPSITEKTPYSLKGKLPKKSQKKVALARVTVVERAGVAKENEHGTASSDELSLVETSEIAQLSKLQLDQTEKNDIEASSKWQMRQFPKTGEEKSSLLNIIGVFICIILVIRLFFIQKLLRE
ncbi:bacterial Ig-like domain-containing protein [Enterococcus faecalis]